MLRKPNLFEYMLIVVAILVSGLGYYYVKLSIQNYGPFSFEVNSLVLILLSIIILLILTAVHENSREILKSVAMEQHAELKLLRQDLNKKRR